MARQKVVALSFEEILEQVSDGVKYQIARPNLYAYKPHYKQYKFHTSDKHTRLYIGGNRSGKTVGGAVEMCYWLMKKHPYRTIPLPEGPVRARACAVDFTYGVDVIVLPEIQKWLPPSFLKNGSWEESYDREHRMLTLANKSFLEFRSYDQDLEKFAGTSRHIIWFDEEPPKHIYNENMARLVDTNGYSMLTMTPVNGMTWVANEIYEPGVSGHEDIDVIEIEMQENPYLSKEAIDRYLNTLDPDERKARERGEFVAIGGRVFKMFNTVEHVIDPIIPPKDWRWFVSIDHGYNNPTAILWHAVSPDNEIVTFHEHYASEMTVEEHAKIFHETNKQLGKMPDFIIGDPAMHQRQGVTGTSIVQEYASRGIYVAQGNNDVLSGVNRMIQYLRIREDGTPSWRVTSNCIFLISEMKKLRWETFSSRKMQYENNKHEKIHKKDDHACDSARYFFSCMPDLTPPEIENRNLNQLVVQHSALIGSVPRVAVAGRYDELLREAANNAKANDPWEYTYGEEY
jgi:phage terminase large subunit-like protein